MNECEINYMGQKHQMNIFINVKPPATDMGSVFTLKVSLKFISKYNLTSER